MFFSHFPASPGRFLLFFFFPNLITRLVYRERHLARESRSAAGSELQPRSRGDKDGARALHPIIMWQLGDKRG